MIRWMVGLTGAVSLGGAIIYWLPALILGPSLGGPVAVARAPLPASDSAPNYAPLPFEQTRTLLAPIGETMLAATRIDAPWWASQDFGGFWPVDSLHPARQMVSNPSAASGMQPLTSPDPGILSVFGPGTLPEPILTPAGQPPVGIPGTTNPALDLPAPPMTTPLGAAQSLVTATPPAAGAVVSVPAPTSGPLSAPTLPATASPGPSVSAAPSTTNVTGISSVTPVVSSTPVPRSATPVPQSRATPTVPGPSPTPGHIALASDHNGIPILQMFNMVPGDSSHGNLTLSNVGSLGLDYGLQVKGGSGPLWTDQVNGLQLKITRLTDNLVLYHGPLAATTGPIGQLAPGEQVLLAVEVWLPKAADNQFQSQAVTVDFVWIATQPF